MSDVMRTLSIMNNGWLLLEWGLYYKTEWEELIRTMVEATEILQ